MGKIIGIDLGTTNSVVAIMEGKEPKVIPNEEGDRITPSVVAFDDKSEVLVGKIARRQAITNPENTIYSVKRFMGRKFDEMQEEVKRVPYKVVRASNGDCAIEIRGKKYSPQEISARILMKLKTAAEAYLGDKVTEAVITVPAYFNDAQRQATKDAGRIAGLDVKRIVNEPTAGALAYGLDKGQAHFIAVYDFGGGTFDISVLEVGDKVVEVASTNGDTHLGGDDIDEIVMQWLIGEFKKDQGIDVSRDKMVLQRLKEAAEKAKIELSNVQETEINLPFLTADATGPKHLQIKLTRAKLEQMMAPAVDRAKGPVMQALKDAGKQASEIAEAVLVGGSTRIPIVAKQVKDIFGKEPHKGVNPDEVVALGAAVQAGVLSGEVKDILLLDVTPLTLGIETLGGVRTPMITRNTTIPTKKTETFSTAADGQTSVEVVVTQGEREMAKDNKLIGRFHLDGIPPAPRGIPQIEVTFDIDANGILHVSAKDKGTGKEKTVRLESGSGLTESEIQRMVKDAEQNEEADKAKKEGVLARNQLDSLVFQIEKTLGENRDKVDEAVRLEVEEGVKKAKKVLEDNKDATGENAAHFQTAFEELQKASYKMAEQMYKTEAPAGEGGAPTDGAASPGANPEANRDVIDAEFEEQR